MSDNKTGFGSALQAVDTTLTHYRLMKVIWLMCWHAVTYLKNSWQLITHIII